MADALRQRAGDQSLPVPNDLPSVQSLVRADLDAREQVGIQRYGTPLQPHNGRDALRDGYEEALDLACYLRQAIEERDQPAGELIASLNATITEQASTIRRLNDLVAELRRQLDGHIRTLERLSQDQAGGS